MNPLRSRWPVVTLALMGLCVAGMVTGAVLALTPPADPPASRKGPSVGAPMPSVYMAPPPTGVLLDDVSPRPSGGPAAPASATAPGADPRSR